ncbi:LOW QUALITY PROTEIN: Hypothetical protein PHPALM_37101 [Phytophthora palmivora]|uniref:Uncharacterized protein n=1 Tax=Phytophthora palmivora TaxID=4796 RepID=A0A2P4WYB0_9STRA|nr:LOW QUALITY PROTEIN: Hypothetical protein PHPALM_37101 [Phytophthora palmivora]
MSWHGALVRLWMFDEEVGEVVETQLYFDHICNGDNKQDKTAVVALYCSFASSRGPHITRLTFQSDNASSYQNAFVGLMLPILGSAHGFYLSRYVHSDTQDCKSMLDAYFATAARKIKPWIRQGKHCATPAVVVKALTADGGLPHCAAELVERDRMRGTLLYGQVQTLKKSLAKIIDRANDVCTTPFTADIIDKCAVRFKKYPACRI